MTITGTQIREARRLLKKTTFWLTRQTGIDYPHLVALQRSENSGQKDSAALKTVRRALEAAGVIFTDDAPPSVRLRKSDPT